MKLFYHIIILTFAILLSCCNLFQKKKTEQKKITEIDTLLTLLEKEHVKIVKFDTSFIKPYKIKMQEHLLLIQDSLDSIDRQTALFLSKYARYKKALIKFNTKWFSLSKDLALSKHQLKNLRHDIENELIPEDSSFIFLQEEKEYALQLITESNEHIRGIQMVVDSLKVLQPEIDKLLDSLIQTKRN
jgi:hypothetical protein